jgi:hypothetical protein
MENSKAVIFCRVITAGQADEKDKVDGKRHLIWSPDPGPKRMRDFYVRIDIRPGPGDEEAAGRADLKIITNLAHCRR